MQLTKFGINVRIARREIGLTLYQMAKDLGYSSAFLCGLEMGREKVTIDILKKIKDYFCKNYKYKIDFNKHSFIRTPKREELIKIMKKAQDFKTQRCINKHE